MKKRNNRIKWRRVLVAGLFVVSLSIGLFQMGKPLFAAAKTWDGGGGDGLWNTAANWSGDTLPTNGDSLIFDVTSLSSSTTLTNNMTGLSVSGITFSGDNASYDYTLTGNALSVSGTIVESTTDNHMSNNHVPQMKMDLNLTGDTTFNMVSYTTGTITNNGHVLTLTSDANANCSVTMVKGIVTGSGGILVQGARGALINNDNNTFTGPITVASGSELTALATSIQNASSITAPSADLSLAIGYSDKTLTMPISLGGTLSVQTGQTVSPCSGDNDIVGDTLTLSGSFTQTGDIVYTGYISNTYDTNTVVTGAYTSNGHALTIDPSSHGTITVPAPPANTVPDAPTGLTPTVGSSQVGLSWTAPASDGGAAISDYVVQYKLTSSGTWSTFADGAGTGTSTTVTGLTNASSYDFRVMAVNSVGQSAPVTVTGITPTAVTTVAGAPTGLIGTPGSTQVALAWTAPASDGGSAITDYTVQYKLTSSGTWLTFVDGTSTTPSATVTGLTNGSSYDFQVRAVNGVGNGPFDTITGVTPASSATAPTAPTFPGATVNTSNGNLVLGWTAPASDGGSAITDYLIEMKLSSASTWSTVTHAPFTGNSFAITTGLTDGQTYDIRISPINSVGTGSSVSILNFLYNSGTGSSGDVSDAGGSGSGGTTVAPNTGVITALTNPTVLIALGVVSSILLLAIAFKRRTIAK